MKIMDSDKSSIHTPDISNFNLTTVNNINPSKINSRFKINVSPVSLRKQNDLRNRKRYANNSAATAHFNIVSKGSSFPCLNGQNLDLKKLNRKDQMLNKDYDKLCKKILLKFYEITRNDNIDYQDLLLKFTKLKKIIIKLDDNLVIDNKLIKILSKMVHWNTPISIHLEILSLLILVTDIHDEYIHFFLHNESLLEIIFNFLNRETNLSIYTGMSYTNDKLDLLSKYVNLLGNLFSINLKQNCLNTLYDSNISDKMTKLVKIFIALLNNYQMYNVSTVDKITWCVASFFQFNNLYTKNKLNIKFDSIDEKLISMLWLILSETYWDLTNQTYVCKNERFSQASILEIVWSLSYLSVHINVMTPILNSLNQNQMIALLQILLIPESNLKLPVIKMLNNLLVQNAIELSIITELLPHLMNLLNMDSRCYIKKNICLLFVNYTDYTLVEVPISILKPFILQLMNITQNSTYYIAKETCLALCNICNQSVKTDNINFLINLVFDSGFSKIIFNFIQISENDLVLILLHTCCGLLRDNINCVKYQQLFYLEGIPNVLAQLTIQCKDDTISNISEILIDKYFTENSD